MFLPVPPSLPKRTPYRYPLAFPRLPPSYPLAFPRLPPTGTP